MACIGTEDEAFKIENTTDLRGVPLKELTDIFRSSKLIVTPSSGPAHLAALCGCKQFIWSGHNNKKRYATDWNPFETECFYVANTWNPEVDFVYNEILKTKLL